MTIARFLILLLVSCTSAAFSQSSSVVLSSLKVTDIIDPSAHELNNFMIEVSVNSPSSLSRLEVILQENEMPVQRLYFPIAVNKEGKAQLSIDKYKIPFEGQMVRFVIKVRDQIKSPYSKILVKGFGESNLETNQLIFNRTK